MTGTSDVLAIPNISEGRRLALVERLVEPDEGVVLLDLHHDFDHNRSVATYIGAPDAVVETCLALAERCIRHLDMEHHIGVHPRHGALDVLPFVPYRAPIDACVRAADLAAAGLASLDLSVYVYGVGASRELPELRRLLRTTPPPPDAGPDPIASRGVVCVGARRPMVAFNVDLEGSLDDARAIAADIRGSGTHPMRLGPVRALAFELSSRNLVQVSMNLVEPHIVGPHEAYARVAALAQRRAMRVVTAEVVGLLPDGVEASTADLPMRAPARTVAEVLRERGRA